jgi:photosystem II stability/assembly factor-like uncharacterized protein
VKSLYFTDANNGWGIGTDLNFKDFIFKTSDGGVTWVQQKPESSENINSIYFVNSNIGWAVGENGIILNTIDGGETWVNQSSNTESNLNSMYFIDANIGWIVGNNGTVLKTYNGGLNWEAQNSGITLGLSSVHFVDSNTGWTVGGGNILKTSNGGSNWIIQNSSPFSLGISSIHFSDEKNGWEVGSPRVMLKTSDGGLNWTRQNSGNTTFNFNSILFIDSNTGWAVGDNGTILRTTNGGEIWANQNSGTTLNFRSVHFLDNKTGWTAGHHGEILIYHVIFSIGQEFISLSESGGSSSFNIEANVHWTIDKDVDWISLQTTSGSNDANISFSYDTNDSATPRDATITISSPGLESFVINLTQEGAVPFLDLGSIFATVGPVRDNIDISIESNVSWSISSNAPWVSFDPQNGDNNASVTIHYEENESTQTRTALIIVSGQGLSDRSFTLIQEGMTSSINDLNQENHHLLIYPNPAADMITLRSNLINGDKALVNIFDIGGKLVKTLPIYQEDKEVSLRIDELTPGIYQIQLVANQNVLNASIIKN